MPGRAGAAESADGRSFAVHSYGISRWMERTGRGRLPYAVHAWRGTERGAARHLTSTEIPGTSGPNWGSVRSTRDLKARIAWHATAGRLPDVLRVYGGPLKGERTVTCAGRDPAAQNRR